MKGCHIFETNRLIYAATHDIIAKAIDDGQTYRSNVGRKIFLPSSFTGSSRYMMQNYLDAMALCKAFGYPDLFLIFTCNPKWPEILRVLKDTTLSPEDRGDYVARMFKIKLDRLVNSIKIEKIFGEIEAGYSPT